MCKKNQTLYVYLHIFTNFHNIDTKIWVNGHEVLPKLFQFGLEDGAPDHGPRADGKVVTVPSFFPPLFSLSLSYFLASFLAGPVLKGETGRTVAAAMIQTMSGFMAQARAGDAKQRRASRVRDNHVAPWVGAR